MATGTVEIKEERGVCTVTFVSVEGAYQGPDPKFDEWLGRHKSAFPPSIIFDLSSVKFMDSRAAGPLISACGLAAIMKSKVVVVALDPRLKELLKIVGLYQLKGVEVYGDIIHAEGSLGESLWQ